MNRNNDGGGGIEQARQRVWVSKWETENEKQFYKLIGFVGAHSEGEHIAHTNTQALEKW